MIFPNFSPALAAEDLFEAENPFVTNLGNPVTFTRDGFEIVNGFSGTWSGDATERFWLRVFDFSTGTWHAQSGEDGFYVYVQTGLIAYANTAYVDQGALIGNDLRFKYLDTNASPNVWTTLNAVIDIGEFGEDKRLKDITGLESDMREYAIDMPDGMELRLALNFKDSDSQWALMHSAYKNDTRMQFRVTVVNAFLDMGFQFPAIVTGWGISGPVGEKAQARFTLKLTGPIVTGAFP